MRLTVYSDLSFRALMFVALRGEGLATIAVIAKVYGISKNHLMKVAYQLGLAGYVETVRGKGGCLHLARRLRDIVLGEMVRRTEPDMALVPCFASDDASCAIYPGYALCGVLSKAGDAFLSLLDRRTLADLMRPRAPLQELLSFNLNGGTATLQPAQRA
jgi:Rrf2 family nitric oxide-sensitive transcriptional repressor